MLLTFLGLAIIVLAMRDVRYELFYPERVGTLSRFIARSLWHLSRWSLLRWGERLYPAGPVIVVAVGAMWFVLVAFGATLVDVAHLPQDFNISPQLAPQEQHGFGAALYVAMSAPLTSAGTSDLTPRTVFMRMTAGIEPVLGLVLIGAWATWVLSIYPIIAERRAFAREVNLLRRAQPDPASLGLGATGEVAALLMAWTAQVVRIATQLAQARVTYYFQNEQPNLSLVANLPYVLQLAQAAERRSDDAIVSEYGAGLRMAVEDLLRDIGDYHLDLQDSPERLLDALTHDQRRALR